MIKIHDDNSSPKLAQGGVVVENDRQHCRSLGQRSAIRSMLTMVQYGGSAGHNGWLAATTNAINV